jgi:bifunctional polynucleotide phosphatase/kinase
MAFTIFHSTQASFDPEQPLKLALFDLDGTLITSKSGKIWAENGDDWVFRGNVPAILQRYAEGGWTVAIITNQSEWSRERTRDGPQTKINTVLDSLFAANGWAPWCLVATGPHTENIYRKPGRGLYDLLVREIGSRHVTEVMMCGDAAGPDAEDEAYRWSDSDLRFAQTITPSVHNSAVVFHTPDSIFGRSKARINPERKEIVILVGNMGSGKSSSARALCAQSVDDDIVCAHTYVHCEQDVLKTPRAMLRAARSALDSGNSVIIDATHASLESRLPYMALAREKGVICRILWHIRDGRSYNKLRAKPVPTIAYVMYSKRFEDPRLDGLSVDIIF